MVVFTGSHQEVHYTWFLVFISLGRIVFCFMALGIEPKAFTLSSISKLRFNFETGFFNSLNVEIDLEGSGVVSLIEPLCRSLATSDLIVLALMILHFIRDHKTVVIFLPFFPAFISWSSFMKSNFLSTIRLTYNAISSEKWRINSLFFLSLFPI